MRSCILCVHVETSSLWVEFVNKNRCISVRLGSEEVKSIRFDNFENSHNYSFLWLEYFIDIFMWKMDPMSGFDIRLVFTLAPRDSTLQYTRCVHFWNNFPCVTSLVFLFQFFPVLSPVIPLAGCQSFHPHWSHWGKWRYTCLGQLFFLLCHVF